MDTKILLIFILLFLVYLLLFYYLKLKNNIIFLLSLIIVLCINKLIIQTEFFYNSNNTNNTNILQNIYSYIKSNGESNSNDDSPKITYMGGPTQPIITKSTIKSLSFEAYLQKTAKVNSTPNTNSTEGALQSDNFNVTSPTGSSSTVTG